jgi:hypothetical protein
MLESDILVGDWSTSRTVCQSLQPVSPVCLVLSNFLLIPIYRRFYYCRSLLKSELALSESGAVPVSAYALPPLST